MRFRTLAVLAMLATVALMVVGGTAAARAEQAPPVIRLSLAGNTDLTAAGLAALADSPHLEDLGYLNLLEIPLSAAAVLGAALTKAELEASR